MKVELRSADVLENGLCGTIKVYQKKICAKRQATISTAAKSTVNSGFTFMPPVSSSKKRNSPALCGGMVVVLLLFFFLLMGVPFLFFSDSLINVVYLGTSEVAN